MVTENNIIKCYCGKKADVKEEDCKYYCTKCWIKDRFIWFKKSEEDKRGFKNENLYSR